MNLQDLISRLGKEYPDIMDALSNMAEQLNKQEIQIKELEDEIKIQRLNTLRLLSWL